MLALKDAGFSFADVQSDVFLPSCMRTTAFSIANCFDVLLYACPCVSDAPHQVAGVTDMCLVHCTHIPASVTKFCSQPGFRVNRTVWRTHIWREIQCFLVKELDCFTSLEGHQNVPYPSQLLKANKVIKIEETRKVEYACHF